MSNKASLIESDLAQPVIQLFPSAIFACYQQVPLARKRIDLVFVQRQCIRAIAVELKISDWKRALWQATLNFLVTHDSYVALWHDFIHRAEQSIDLFKSYGVGLISVEPHSARYILASREPQRRINRTYKRQWYHNVMNAHENRE